jgi:hypothetical protein
LPLILLIKEETHMNRYRWIPIVAAVVLAALVGVMAYNAGVAHGMQATGKMMVVPWHPWGFGFFFGPLFFIFFFFLIARGLFWRGRCGYARRAVDDHPRG